MKRSHRRTTRLAPVALASAAACGLAAALAAGPARAQVLERFALRGEGGAGTMLAGYQHDTLGYDVMVYGAARLGFTLIDPLALQVSFDSTLGIARQGENGQQFSVTGGLRLEPRIGAVGRLFLDGNVGLGQTIGLSRLAVDAGLGFEFALAPWLGLGPVVRYHHLFANTDVDYPSDAMFWTAGLTLALRVPQRNAVVPAAPVDTDRDGVFDPEDLCVTEPAGPQPDPERRGCPLRDSDGDGVFDRDDLCVHEAAGAHPDPARRGCPAGDSDNDGVLDPDDQCPSTPRGEHPDPERAGCPDGDDDADGVFNHADQCRTEPAGIHPDPARPGCPLPDRDHDTVPDPTDACPDQPGAPSTNPRRNGCPGLLRIEGHEIRIMRPVFFATNRDVILPRSRPVLAAIADALRADTNIRRVTIDGHTDDVGDDAFNQNLSERRAASVVAALTRLGVTAERLEAHGFGETHPRVPVAPGMNRSAANRARAANRRVELHIVDPPPSGPHDGAHSDHVAPATSAPAASPTAPATAAPVTTSAPSAPGHRHHHGHHDAAEHAPRSSTTAAPPAHSTPATSRSTAAPPRREVRP